MNHLPFDSDLPDFEAATAEEAQDIVINWAANREKSLLQPEEERVIIVLKLSVQEVVFIEQVRGVFETRQHRNVGVHGNYP